MPTATPWPVCANCEQRFRPNDEFRLYDIPLTFNGDRRDHTVVICKNCWDRLNKAEETE